MRAFGFTLDLITSILDISSQNDEMLPGYIIYANTK